MTKKIDCVFSSGGGDPLPMPGQKVKIKVKAPNENCILKWFDATYSEFPARHFKSDFGTHSISSVTHWKARNDD